MPAPFNYVHVHRVDPGESSSFDYMADGIARDSICSSAVCAEAEHNKHNSNSHRILAALVENWPKFIHIFILHVGFGNASAKCDRQYT